MMEKKITFYKNEWRGPICIDSKNVSIDEIEKCLELYINSGYAKSEYRISSFGSILAIPDQNYQLPV